MMFLLSLFVAQAIASPSMGPTTFPVFLKEGFSTILEFEEAPTQVVLGDQNLFQVERLNRSIVIKPMVPYATTNMFVYFKSKDTKLFLLTASEESEPTYYKKFASFVPKPAEKPKVLVQTKYKRGLHIRASDFDKKKDYLTVDFIVAADSTGKVAPSWDLVRLKHKDRAINPTKLWSERREAQRDSFLKARLIFAKPNVPSDLKDVSLIVPIKGASSAWSEKLNGAKQ
jgi:hypothetical protein